MKTVLLGLSGTEKTTIGDILRKNFGFPVVEADDEVIQRNSGLWPDEEALINTSLLRIMYCKQSLFST